MFAQWRKTLIIIVLSVTFSIGLWASDKESEGMALINRSIALTDLRQSAPYQRHSRLTVADEAVGKREGTEVVTFSSPERWRRELHMTGYDEVAVFLGKYMYRTRSLAFTPPSLRSDISGSLRSLPETLGYKVVRLSNRKINDIPSRCVLLQQQGDRRGEVTWCFDSQTGLPVEEISGNGHGKVEFSDYKPFGSKFVPGTVEIEVGGKKMRKAVIEKFDSAISDAEHIFDAPIGAIGKQWCDDMQSPKAISVFPVDIPLGARLHSGLELNYELAVDARGNVNDVIPMAPKPYVDRIAIGTMRAWQFKPAMCGDTPVNTDIWIDIAR